MRVIIDTNCLLASVPQKSQYRWLYDAVLTGKIEVAITTEILMEYEEQLGLFYSPDYATLIVNTLVNLPNVLKVNPLYFYWLAIENDPDDNKFVDAAVASNADCIITNDRHFNVLKTREFPDVPCFRLPEFESVLLNL